MNDSRALLAALHAAAVQGAAPYLHTKRAVDRWLSARPGSGTDEVPPVHVFALGKAAWAMAEGACAALTDRGLTVAGGVVVTNHLPMSAEAGHVPSLPPELRRAQG
ncbi:MAG TPA: DUF4147 domain-containing protein, partial [Gemmatimonas sp.]|uniref:DUF4147 domain-containing protein n=1 Tax=Gemmatimonas sp. TaxID=1962908 RepID=UPI002EDA00E0